MISAAISGRAGGDGELRQSAGGKPWSRLGIACDAGTASDTGRSETVWVTVIAFGRLAEELAAVRKGELLGAIGRVTINRWVAKDGTAREDLQLIADSLLSLHGSNPAGARSRTAAGPAGEASVRIQAPADKPLFF